MGQTERVLRIQQLLRERPAVSRRSFLEELEISAAQFKRDLAFLSDRFQVRIDYAPGRRSYVRAQDKESVAEELPGPMYSAGEISALPRLHAARPGTARIGSGIEPGMHEPLSHRDDRDPELSVRQPGLIPGRACPSSAFG